jgi:hypothetical protein
LSVTEAAPAKRLRHTPGPFTGEHWGPYTIIKELVPLKRDRMFAVRCMCGADSVLRRSQLMVLDQRQTLGCPACRGANHGLGTRLNYPPRWPDGVYGVWRLIERVPHEGQWKWVLRCSGCGLERHEARLRARPQPQPCQKCSLLARQEARMRARSRARAGSQMVRVKLS